MRKCPTCSSDLRAPYISCDSCSWSASTSRPRAHEATSADCNHLRCAWVADGEQCRYIAGCSSDGRTYFCLGHFGCGDPMLGLRIVEESIEAHPVTQDLSWRGVMDDIRRRYLAGEGVPRAPRLRPGSLGSAMAKIVKPIAPLAFGESLADPESIAERRAIQQEAS